MITGYVYPRIRIGISSQISSSRVVISDYARHKLYIQAITFPYPAGPNKYPTALQARWSPVVLKQDLSPATLEQAGFIALF